jgi:phosphatidylglycerophosphate synthase
MNWNWLPKALIYFRLCLVPVMLLWAYYIHHTGWFLVVCLWLGLLSDIFDGIIARKLGVATDWLRKADGWVDLIFWIVAGWCIWLFNHDLIIKYLPFIILLFCLEPISDLINYVKFRRSGCAHNWLSKFLGIMLLITFSILFAGYHPETLFIFCLILTAISQIDRIIISSLLPNPECDIPTFYHAYLRRKGRSFKRYKLFN